MGDAEIAASPMRRIRLLMKLHEQHENRQDIRAGVVAASIANAMGGGKKGGGGFTPADFFPHLTQREPEKTIEESAAEMRAFAIRHNRSL